MASIITWPSSAAITQSLGIDRLIQSVPPHDNTPNSKSNTLVSTREGCHPSIIDFQTQFGIDQWPAGHANKYRYLAAFSSDELCDRTEGTPEDIFLMVSDDGVNWVAPPRWVTGSIVVPATTEPLQITSAACGGDFYSDPCLAYNQWTDTVHLYYNLDNDTVSELHHIPISNTWVLGSLTTVDVFDPNDEVSLQSIAVVFESATIAHSWSQLFWPGNAANGYTKEAKIKYIKSTDGGVTWDNLATAKLWDDTTALCNDIALNWPNTIAWHQEVKFRPGSSNTVDMLMYIEPVAVDNANVDTPYFISLLSTTLTTPKVLTFPLGTGKLIDCSASGGRASWAYGCYKSSFVPKIVDYKYYIDLWLDFAPCGVYVAGAYRYSTHDQFAVILDSDIGLVSGPATNNNRVAGAYYATVQITLSIPSGSTADSIDYGWGETEPTPITYSGPINIQEGTLWVRGVEGATPGDWKTVDYTLRTTNLSTIDGSEAGVFKKINGSDGGTLKRFVSGGWQ